MPLGTLFWVIYVVAIIFGFWFNYEANQPLWYRRAGVFAIFSILIGILGYEVFGSVVRK